MFESFLKPPITFPTLTGSIVTFNSQYAGLPLKSHKIALTATQSGSGTPSPVNIRNINGWSSLNIGHYGLNVWGNGITLSDASISGTYKGFKKKYNSNIRMVLFDRDTTQDISGVFLGFTGSGKDSTEGIQWVISNGNIFSEGNIFSDTYEYISIYPGTQETLDKIFNRFYVLTVIDSGDYSAYVPYVGGNTTITIGSTVYGGEYDARTGVLTVTHKLLNLNDIVWAYEADTAYPRFVGNTTGQGLKPVPDNNTVANDLCNRYQICTVTEGYGGVKTNSIAQTTADRLWVWDTNYTDLNSFKASFSTLQIVAELATPQTIQLPPCPIDTLEGVNNIWADTGDTTLQYIKFG